MKSLIDWFAGKPLKVAIIVLTAAVAHWLLVRLIARLTRRVVRLGEATNTSRADSRVTSLNALLGRIVTIAVWALAVVTVLSVFGINIAPILASAGVVGVALGFGAQELVRDYLAGIFLIVEDQFGVNDVVDLGEVKGTVQEVGLRATTVRADDGVLWYVRNGQILRVGNRSKARS